MPTFADCKTSSQIFHEKQCEYYGIQGGQEPPMNDNSDSNGRVPNRKPVGSAPKNTHNGAYARVPARKPIAGSSKNAAAANKADLNKPLPHIEDGAYAQVPTRKPAAGSSKKAAVANKPDLNKPLPRIPRDEPLPFISRDAEGKFDLRTRTHTGAVPQCPIIEPECPLLSECTPPGPATESRPGSSSGWSFKSLTSFSGSRRSSIAEAAKHAGKWAKNKAEILAMTKAERENFIEETKKAHSREVEAARQRNPSSRPLHQQQAVAEKQHILATGEPLPDGLYSTAYQSALQDRWAQEQTPEFRRRKHAAACAAAALEGKPRPTTPPETTWMPLSNSLNSFERQQALDSMGLNAQLDEKHEFGLGDRFALQLSKALDGMKRERRNSDGSDMDFGMTDSAPLGAMYVCGGVPGHNFGKGCSLPFSTFLKDGLCDACYRTSKFQYRQQESFIGK